MEAELEEVKDVWEEDIGGNGKGGGNGLPAAGSGGHCSGGGGGGGGVGVGVGGNGGDGWGVAAVVGKPTAPRGKSWMIVSEKMVEEYSL